MEKIYKHKDRKFFLQGKNILGMPGIMVSRILVFVWCSGPLVAGDQKLNSERNSENDP